MREMATLCTILDHIAKKRFMAAADVAGQRLKAVEASIVDGGWDRAQFLELVEPEGPLLADRGEQHMTARELEFRRKLSGKGSWRQPGPHETRDKGQKTYEKGLGKKGKKKDWNGKGKGPKGAPPPAE